MSSSSAISGGILNSGIGGGLRGKCAGTSRQLSSELANGVAEILCHRWRAPVVRSVQVKPYMCMLAEARGPLRTESCDEASVAHQFVYRSLW